jgi:hypothetical protein
MFMVSYEANSQREEFLLPSPPYSGEGVGGERG